MELNSCHALVTGGASGLGAATAAAVINHGGTATILDRDDQRGSETTKLWETQHAFDWLM